MHRPLAFCLVSIVLISSACSSDVESQPVTSSVPNSTDGDPITTTPPVDSTEPSGASIIDGAHLPMAPESHGLVDVSVGMPAPILTVGDVIIPSDRPALLLVATGSCADCTAAAESLTALATEFDALAVVIGDTGSAPEPWQVVRDENAARAFGGRDRPTAIVIGPDGTVLSRTRPFNDAGTEYDQNELRFGLEIATNQKLKPGVGQAVVAIADQRSGPLPDNFFAVQSDGDAVEIDTASGVELNRIPAPPGLDEPEGMNQVFDEVIPIPGGAGLLLNECCEPAAGRISLLQDWDDFDLARSRAAFNRWEASVSADGDRIAFSGYSREIVDVGPADQTTRVSLGVDDGSVPDVAWLRDRLGVAFLHRGTSPAIVEIIELDDGYRPISRRNLSLRGPASSVDVNAAGQLVVVAANHESPAAAGEVYNPDSGELVAEFALEDGVKEFDYDVTGRYLAYVDGEQTARWQGGGQTGVLGENYLTVNW